MLFGAKKARECRDIVHDTEKRVEVVGEILNEEERRSLILGDEPISDDQRRRRELNLRSRHILCKACFGKSDPVSVTLSILIIHCFFLFVFRSRFGLTIRRDSSSRKISVRSGLKMTLSRSITSSRINKLWSRSRSRLPHRKAINHYLPTS